MFNKSIKVRTKLLGGFLGILLLAGFACMTGMRGIQRINYQNRIGVLVDEVLGDVHEAQAAALRFIIYHDDDYQDHALSLIDDVVTRAEKAGDMMTISGNRDETGKLLEKIEEYRRLVHDFSEIEARRGKAEVERIEEGLDLIEQLGEIRHVFTEQGAQQSAAVIQDAIDRINSLRTPALEYSLQKTDSGRIEIAEEWIAELASIRDDMNKLESTGLSDTLSSMINQSIEKIIHYAGDTEIYHESEMDRWALLYSQRETAALMILQGDKVRAGVQKTNDDATLSAISTMSVTLGLAILFSILIAVVLSHNITAPLIKGTGVAINIAAGKLDSAELDLKRKDELGELASALDKMSESLKIQHWLLSGKQELDDKLRGDRKLEALEKLGLESEIDLVLMDIMMPRMDMRL